MEPKTGAQGGTQTHESTDLQSAPLVALVPVHCIGVRLFTAHPNKAGVCRLSTISPTVRR